MTRVSLIDTESSIYIHLLNKFKFWSQKTIDNEQKAFMWVFPKAIVFTTKPRFGVMRTYCVKVRLASEGNRLRENPHRCYYTWIVATT